MKYQTVKKILLAGLQLIFLEIIFTFNIWLINQGSGFTKPREMLFRTYADIFTPLVIFPIIYFLFLAILKLSGFLTKNISRKTINLIIFGVCLISAFSLFRTVQTNPDYGRYHVEAKYFADNGPIKTLKEWGNFNFPADLPTIPFLFGITYQLLGKGPLAVLLTSLLIFSGIIYFTYLIAKKLFDERVAIFSIVLLSTTPFVLTQTPLMLVDLGETFFLLFSFWAMIQLVENPTVSRSLSAGIIFFLTSLTKVLSFIYLGPLFLIGITYSIIKFPKSLKNLLTSWGIMITLDSFFLCWKKELIKTVILEVTSGRELQMIIIPLLFLSFLIVLFFLIFLTTKNKIDKKIINSRPIFLIYIFLLVLFVYGGRYSFYLRTLFVATNIPLALLFYGSFYVISKEKSKRGWFLIPIALAANFLPHTMFKYQLPSYPAIMLLAAFSLTAIFKETRKQIYVLGIILAFSLTTTYFFFLPMINNHVKINIRNAAEYANQLNAKKITLLFFPVGEYGRELSEYIEDENKLPTPSLSHLLDFYARGEVDYQTIPEFFSNLKKNNLPDLLVLATHLNLPFNLENELLQKIRANYIEGPTFERADGAGIWRVKLKVYH